MGQLKGGSAGERLLDAKLETELAPQVLKDVGLAELGGKDSGGADDLVPLEEPEVENFENFWIGQPVVHRSAQTDMHAVLVLPDDAERLKEILAPQRVVESGLVSPAVLDDPPRDDGGDLGDHSGEVLGSKSIPKEDDKAQLVQESTVRQLDDADLPHCPADDEGATTPSLQGPGTADLPGGLGRNEGGLDAVLLDNFLRESLVDCGYEGVVLDGNEAIIKVAEPHKLMGFKGQRMRDLMVKATELFQCGPLKFYSEQVVRSAPQPQHGRRGRNRKKS